MTQTNETVIETHLLANGYVTVNRDGFDRERAIFPATVLAFIRATQPKEWVNLDARRTATERTIVPLKERCTALIAAAVTGRITICESTEDTLLGQWGGTIRCYVLPHMLSLGAPTAVDTATAL